jgi:hypothetical protein
MRTLVICSAIESRLGLLKKSLPTWQGADVAIYHDGCQSDIPCQFSFSTPAPSGSHIKGYNWGAQLAREHNYNRAVFTHPEILFSPAVIGEVQQDYGPKPWSLHFQVFWLKGQVVDHIPEDTAGFDPDTLQLVPGFFNTGGSPDGPINWNIDRPSDVQSTTTYAMAAEYLHIMFPQPEFDCWGPDDPWNMMIRAERGVRTLTSNSSVYHQPHELLGDWAKYNDCVARMRDFV